MSNGSFCRSSKIGCSPGYGMTNSNLFALNRHLPHCASAGRSAVGGRQKARLSSAQPGTGRLSPRPWRQRSYRRRRQGSATADDAGRSSRGRPMAPVMHTSISLNPRSVGGGGGGDETLSPSTYLSILVAPYITARMMAG